LRRDAGSRVRVAVIHLGHELIEAGVLIMARGKRHTVGLWELARWTRSVMSGDEIRQERTVTVVSWLPLPLGAGAITTNPVCGLSAAGSTKWPA
jgi:hypothetical protein